MERIPKANKTIDERIFKVIVKVTAMRMPFLKKTFVIDDDYRILKSFNKRTFICKRCYIEKATPEQTIAENRRVLKYLAVSTIWTDEVQCWNLQLNVAYSTAKYEYRVVIQRWHKNVLKQLLDPSSQKNE